MPVKWYDGAVTRILDEGPVTKRFWVSVTDPEPFEFKAGQFVTMDLPVSEKRLHRWRSYSIANAPGEGNELEFCIVHLNGGLASGYFFNEVKVGTVIRFKGPDGAFTLPGQIDKKLVFVCTGTGIAPFRSMIHDIRSRNLPTKGIHLIFGARAEDGILYREEFEKLQKEWPDFRYDIALSRQPDWKGYKGYVHQVYQEHYPKPRPDVVFYLCGWSNMIDDAVANIIVKLGFDKSQVRYELYG